MRTNSPGVQLHHPLLPSRLFAFRLPPHMGRTYQDPPPHPADLSPMCGGGGAPRDQVPLVQAAERLLRLHLAISEEQMQLGCPCCQYTGLLPPSRRRRTQQELDD